MLYPVTNEHRSIIDLNGIWQVKLEGNHDTIDVTRPLNTDLVMAVPGSYNDQGVTTNIRNHGGNVWYARIFTIPNVLSDERIVLRSGSATHEATVYIECQEVTSQQGGLWSFDVESNHSSDSGRVRLPVCVINM